MLKNKKILLSILVALILLLVPNMVKAAVIEAQETTTTSTGVIVKWSYELSQNEITNLKCTNVAAVTGELTIPDTIDEHKVITLGNECFEKCYGLRKITIPSGVTAIGNYAFRGCSGLSSITIPNGVTTVGTGAFRDCSGLRNVKLSNNLTKINDYVFYGCSGLTEIELPDSVTTIGGTYFYSSPFDSCTGLKFIKIPENVVSVPDWVFDDCKNLTIYGKVGSYAETYAKNNNINFEKIENWDKRNEINGSDVSAPTVSSMYIDYDTVMGYYDLTTKDYRVPRDIQISIIVEFSEQIKGTQIPILTIKCGEGANIELKNGTVTGNKIIYTYKINKNDKGLIAAVSLTGGNVQDASRKCCCFKCKRIKGKIWKLCLC